MIKRKNSKKDLSVLVNGQFFWVICEPEFSLLSAEAPPWPIGPSAAPAKLAVVKISRDFGTK